MVVETGMGMMITELGSHGDGGGANGGGGRGVLIMAEVMGK